ncbi:PqqD family protein [uncultured Sphingomonas sp.]|uniref:PqqD family protein n=1 Tax=uncultured Sphingomonas sp. TaxID=158754 RepID=UPI00258E55B2|nr:PqqD family protein [uncultured Sphingomonas sp.]
MTVDGQTVIQRAPDCIHTDVGDEAVLLGGDAYVALNPVGKAIWHHIAEPIALDTLWQKLAAAYDAPVATIERDTAAFLATLRTQGMIEVVTPAPAGS